MVAIDEVEFATLRDRFNREWKRIEPYTRKPLTSNVEKLIDYRTSIVGT